MDDAPSKEPEVFKQPYPCLNEQLANRITEAIQTDELSQVEKVYFISRMNNSLIRVF